MRLQPGLHDPYLNVQRFAMDWTTVGLSYSIVTQVNEPLHMRFPTICDILTSEGIDKPVHHPFKLRNSK